MPSPSSAALTFSTVGQSKFSKPTSFGADVLAELALGETHQGPVHRLRPHGLGALE